MSKLEFKTNKVEQSVDVYQTNGISRIRIASFDLNRSKVVLKYSYRKELESRKISLKEVCEVIEFEYYQWLKSTSPLRNLTEDQNRQIVNLMRRFTVLTACIKDVANDLAPLNDLDMYNEVSPDIKRLSDQLDLLTNKTLHNIGYDKYLEIADTADKVNELIDQSLCLQSGSVA